MRTVTQRDIARAAGMSQATVSRALNAERMGMVSEETAARVVRAAEQLGYRATPARPPPTVLERTLQDVIADITG